MFILVLQIIYFTLSFKIHQNHVVVVYFFNYSDIQCIKWLIYDAALETVKFTVHIKHNILVRILI